MVYELDNVRDLDAKNSFSIMKEVSRMAHELLAKSDHQLGMCLRMLYAEGIRGPLPVHSAKNEKGKMEFLVTVPVDDAQFEVLERRYQTLIG